MQNRNWLVFNSQLEFAAAPRDQSVDIKLQSYSTARHFETSHAFRIAYQKIREPQRNGITGMNPTHATTNSADECNAMIVSADKFVSASTRARSRAKSAS